MKLRSPLTSAACVAFGGLALALSVGVFRAQADQWNKKTVLTIDQPIQVTDTYLEPGTYVFKLADSSADRHVVQIFTADERHIINTVMAIPNYRLEPTGNSRFAFWETPPGTARAMRAWFYPGDNFGQEFPYPKQLRPLAALQTPEPALVEPPPPPPAPAPEPITAAPEPAPPAPTTQAQVEEPSPAPAAPEAPQENAEPPAPPPQAAPSPEPSELPTTASPYPTIGLGGLFALGLYGLVRRLRTVKAQG